MPAAPQFSKDVVPLSDLKVNPGRIVHQVDERVRVVRVWRSERLVTPPR